MFKKIALISSLIIFSIYRNIASSKLIELLLIRKDWANTFIFLLIISIFITYLILIILINFYLPAYWQWPPVNIHLFSNFVNLSPFMFCFVFRTCQLRIILCWTLALLGCIEIYILFFICFFRWIFFLIIYFIFIFCKLIIIYFTFKIFDFIQILNSIKRFS
jgi:hypothetical protein